MLDINLQKYEDLAEIETLLDLVFGQSRYELSSYRFRDNLDPIHELSLVLRDEYNVVIGSIRYWPILLGVQKVPGLLLGPLGIHPTRQGEGYGGLLIKESLKRAVGLGWKSVILIGDLSYYSRFGFSQKVVKNLNFKYPVNNNRFLGCELVKYSLVNLSGPLSRIN